MVVAAVIILTSLVVTVAIASIAVVVASGVYKKIIVSRF